MYALSIFLVYVASCTAGILMAHGGSPLALAQRDRVVGQAVQNDKASGSYRAGRRLTAALQDFAANVDVGYVYLASLPLFLAGSCFEFLSSWNVY
jgi:hypothetical protein